MPWRKVMIMLEVAAGVVLGRIVLFASSACWPLTWRASAMNWQHEDL